MSPKSFYLKRLARNTMPVLLIALLAWVCELLEPAPSEGASFSLTPVDIYC